MLGRPGSNAMALALSNSQSKSIVATAMYFLLLESTVVLVIYRPPGPAGRHDQFTADRPGFVRCQEYREVGNLRTVHHTTDSVTAWRIRGKVTLLHFLRGNAQLNGAGG